MKYLANFNDEKFWKRASRNPIVKGQHKIAAKNDPDYGKYRTKQGLLEKGIPGITVLGSSALLSNYLIDRQYKKAEKNIANWKKEQEIMKDLTKGHFPNNPMQNPDPIKLPNKLRVKATRIGLPLMAVGAGMAYGFRKNKYSPFYSENKNK